MSNPNNAQERDTHLLSVGRQCSAPTCLLVDFLPFKCRHCEDSFCGDHFKTAAHNCPKYDETKYNRIAPNCPLCNEPIAFRPGQDPNIRMDQHISNECSVMTGKSGKTKSTPVCAKVKCGKVLFAPIQCNGCSQQFCPQHRFPADHTCAKASAPPAATSQTPGANLGARANAAGAAMRRAVASASTPSAGPSHTRQKPVSQTPSPASSKTSPLPFSKTDRLISSNAAPMKSHIPALSHNETRNNITNSMPTMESAHATEIILKSSPEPIIDALAFAPPMLFASA